MGALQRAFESFSCWLLKWLFCERQNVDSNLKGIQLQLLCLDITLRVSASGGNDSGQSGILFRSLKCFHIPFSLHVPNYFCTDLHSNGPDNFLMSNPNQCSSLQLVLLWFGFTQHVWNTLLRFLSTGWIQHQGKWVSRAAEWASEGHLLSPTYNAASQQGHA